MSDNLGKKITLKRCLDIGCREPTYSVETLTNTIIYHTGKELNKKQIEEIITLGIEVLILERDGIF